MARQHGENPHFNRGRYDQDEALIQAQMHGHAMPQPQQCGVQPYPQIQAE